MLNKKTADKNSNRTITLFFITIEIPAIKHKMAAYNINLEIEKICAP